MSQASKQLACMLGVSTDPADTLAREACKTAETSCSGCGSNFCDDELDDDWNCPACARFLDDAVAAAETGASP